MTADPTFWAPSFASITEYAAEVESEGHHVNFAWAHEEIAGSFLDYVRAGVAAFAIKRYKLYLQAEVKCKNFRTYCETMLGKSVWQVNRIIQAARVTLHLASQGFTQLPTCESQARPLTQFLPPEERLLPNFEDEDKLTEKWQEIIDMVPKHKINATIIQEIVNGEPPNSKKQIQIPAEIYRELAEKASLSGMSPQELLNKLVRDYEVDVPLEDTEAEKTSGDLDLEDNNSEDNTDENPDEIKPITHEQLTHWLADMQELLKEHYGYEPIGINST